MILKMHRQSDYNYSAKLAIPLAKFDDFIQFSRSPDAYLQEF